MLYLKWPQIIEVVCNQVTKNKAGRIISSREVLPSEWFAKNHWNNRPDVAEALQLVAKAAADHAAREILAHLTEKRNNFIDIAELAQWLEEQKK